MPTSRDRGLHEFAELEQYESPWPRMGGSIEKPWVDCERSTIEIRILARWWMRLRGGDLVLSRLVRLDARLGLW